MEGTDVGGCLDGGAHCELRSWSGRDDLQPRWAIGIVIGAFMLSYALTLAAMAEILKAHVGALDAAVASLVFALTSIVTIAAPVVVVLVAPARSAQVLATWKTWLLQHARSIALILLMVIGVFLVVRGVYDVGA